MFSYYFMRTLRYALIVFNTMLAAIIVFYVGLFCVYQYDVHIRTVPIHEVKRVETFDELAALPEDQIDLFQAALLLSKEVHPDVDADAAMNLLDEMAFALKQEIRWKNSIEHKLYTIYKFLYQEKNFQYGGSEPGNPRNFRVDLCLKDRVADCLTSSVIGAALGKRVGVPIQLVARYENYHILMASRNDNGDQLYFEMSEKGYKIESPHAFAKQEKIHPNLYETLNPKPALSELLVEIGNHHHYANQNKKADGYYQRALKYHPRNPKAYHFRSILASLAGQYQAAINLSGKSVEYKPEFASPYMHLGKIFIDRKHYQIATFYNWMALLRKPDYGNALTNLAICSERLGHEVAAINLYLKALEYNPNHHYATHNLGKFFNISEFPEDPYHFYKKLANQYTGYELNGQSHTSKIMQLLKQKEVVKAWETIKEAEKQKSPIPDHLVETTKKQLKLIGLSHLIKN